MVMYYDIQGHTPVPMDFLNPALHELFDINKRGKERIVANDQWTNGAGTEITVSTVFLVVNHEFIGDGPPILFETMVFGGDHDEFQLRYHTWEMAEFGHTLTVLWLMGYGDRPE